MHLLEIILPEKRTLCGCLTLKSPTGAVEVGPVPVAGKVGDRLARERHNPTRTPLLPYGDTPTGSYRLSRLLSMRDAAERDVAKYGRFGVAVFDPCDGDAALAEAAGRFELWLHGGVPILSKRLLSTAGSLRLFDEDHLLLMRALSRIDSAHCIVSLDSSINGQYGAVEDDSRMGYSDPPSLGEPNPAAVGEAALLRSLAYANNPSMLYLGEYDSGQSFSAIDVSVVIDNEGGVGTSVIVPRAGDGYTVGAGVNLSEQTVQGLLDDGVDPSTVDALSSVIGVMPPDGSTESPGISISSDAATQLTTAVMNAYFNATGAAYSDDCDFANFTDLPSQAQTAIADLAYNMGPLSSSAPTLWGQITSGNWQGAIDNLTGTNGQPPFSSQDPTLNNRAIADGQLLQQAQQAGTLPTPGN